MSKLRMMSSPFQVGDKLHWTVDISELKELVEEASKGNMVGWPGSQVEIKFLTRKNISDPSEMTVSVLDRGSELKKNATRYFDNGDTC